MEELEAEDFTVRTPALPLLATRLTVCLPASPVMVRRWIPPTWATP